MSELVPLKAALPALGQEIVLVEEEIRYEQAILDAMRRARTDLREQVEILRRIVERAVEVPAMVDAMREAGELAELRPYAPDEFARMLRKARTWCLAEYCRILAEREAA